MGKTLGAWHSSFCSCLYCVASDRSRVSSSLKPLPPSPMPLSASRRKAMLLVHILSSAGWIGAVAAFLVLAIASLYGSRTLPIGGVYLAMELIADWLILPLAFLSLITGVLQALSTSWGLFRHYWVLFKLLINVLSLPILLLHMQIIHRVAAVAITGNFNSSGVKADRRQLVVAGSAALLALMIAMFLSVFKPKGVTGYGRPAKRS